MTHVCDACRIVPRHAKPSLTSPAGGDNLVVIARPCGPTKRMSVRALVNADSTTMQPRQLTTQMQPHQRWRLLGRRSIRHIQQRLYGAKRVVRKRGAR